MTSTYRTDHDLRSQGNSDIPAIAMAVFPELLCALAQIDKAAVGAYIFGKGVAEIVLAKELPLVETLMQSEGLTLPQVIWPNCPVMLCRSRSAGSLTR